MANLDIEDEVKEVAEEVALEAIEQADLVSRDDFDELQARVEKLEAAIEELQQGERS